KRSPNDFTFGQALGEGSYSTVLIAVEKSTGKEFAAKIIDKKHIIREKKTKYAEIEKRALNRLHHPSIVRLHYTFQDPYSLYFILDLARSGELLTWIRKLGGFSTRVTQHYAAELIHATAYIHDHGIVHRDIKPENILLDENMHIKITDFGTAKLFDSPDCMSGMYGEGDREKGQAPIRASSFVGTAEYVSPELLKDKAVSCSSDWWALGCVIYQMLVGRPPFKAGNEYQTFQKILHLDYSFPSWFPEDAKDLVSSLLTLHPEARLGSQAKGGVRAIKEHPFFQGIDWDHIWKISPPEM
ncbi:MAG: phosphoinositide-dependent protein kinase 1 3-{5--1h pyrrol-3-Yl}-N-(2-piperidin-1-Yl-ethyl)-benzamide complex, partial [Piptocephalis tieghemiana]